MMADCSSCADLRAQLTAAVQEQERLERERDELLLDRHQPDRLSPCGHYRVFAMPLLLEDGTEQPYCMQCNRDELQTRSEDAAAQITALRELVQKVAREMRKAATYCERHTGGDVSARAVRQWADLLTAPARGETRQQETKEEIIAEALARMAHDGQKEESTGDPYIKHVERVVAMVEGKARVVAWLHDVLEDSDQFTAGDLRVAGISEPVVDALWLLTRFDEVPYNTYIESIRRAEHPLAIEVKLADLRDHLRPNCPERLRPRYEKAWATLTNQPLPSVSTLDGGETRRDEGRKEARKDEPR